MRKYLVLFASLFLSSALAAQVKRMCISVDDLPTVSYQLESETFNLNLTQNLLEAFTLHDVPAIGFVNERKLYKEGKLDSAKLKVLELWLAAGMDLGNHTYDHSNYHRVSFETFTSSIMKGDVHSRPLARSYGDSIQYFRHPYLRVGKTASQADSLERFLSENGYIVSPVTIDNEDYLFALAYSRAYGKGDSAMAKKIGKDYVDYMVSKVKYYESQSVKLFDRHIAQTLLVHASLLNAHLMEELLSRVEELGYKFVSQSEVLQDSAYSSPVTAFGDWGISWIDRWALSQGKKGAFFQGDIQTPDYIRELSR